MRSAILDRGARPDGRAPDALRPIQVDVGPLPRAHGSALFTRGETQALAVATLGTGSDEQFIEALEGPYRERFMLHYNFPKFSVGETGRELGPGRREIGHGALARRALLATLPDGEDFPYTLRLVSEILESNGSSSMATVCACSLAMMDAGAPVPRATAGIAMGLIKDGSRDVVLTDIVGDEDHLGDMDFKVAGTRDGVTALQMDIKIPGLDRDIMTRALEQAKTARLEILDIMEAALPHARDGVSTHAPQMRQITIPKEKIRDLIGPGGRVVRAITEETGASVDIGDDGVVRVASADPDGLAAALARVEGITAEPEEGRIYDGKVVKIMPFGAFVNIMGGRDGLVHISELADHRVNEVTDVVNDGDDVQVRCLGVDERGRVRLTMRGLDEEYEAPDEAEEEGPEEAPEEGRVYEGRVVKVVPFGAFVNFIGKRDGLVHISELAEGRVEAVRDVVDEGDDVRVRYLGADDRGRVRLTMRGLDEEYAPRDGGGDGDDDDGAVASRAPSRAASRAPPRAPPRAEGSRGGAGGGA